MPFTTLTKPAVGKPTLKSLADAIIDNLSFLYNSFITTGANDTVPNSSFEIDVDADSQPDQWEATEAGNTVISLDNTSGKQKHGEFAVKFHATGTATAGSFIQSTDFILCADEKNLNILFAVLFSGATVTAKVSVRCYDYDQAFISELDIWDATSGNPTVWTYKFFGVPLAAGTRFIKLKFYGINSTTSGSVWFDDVRIGGDIRARGPNARIIQATGTFVVPWYCSRIKAYGWGGGGGGAKRSSGTISGGGGAGAYVEAIIDVFPGETLDCTVGAAGVGATTNDTDGGDGGSTLIKRSATTIFSAGGGGGGDRPAGGAGGVGSAGQINIDGDDGADGSGGTAGVGGDTVMALKVPYSTSEFASGGDGGNGVNGQNGKIGYLLIEY